MPENLELMRMMDAEHMEHPFLGVRGMTLWLNRAMGANWNRKRVRRLMRQMGLETIYPKPHHAHRPEVSLINVITCGVCGAQLKVSYSPGRCGKLRVHE